MEKIKKNRKGVILTLILIFSLMLPCFSAPNAYIFMLGNLINILFVLLGFAITSYTFIYSPICNMIKGYKEKTEDLDEVYRKADKLFSNIKEDIVFMFFVIIIIVVIDYLHNMDIPFLKDVLNISIGLVNIKSLKDFMLKSSSTFFIGIALYSFYDIIKVMFKLVERSFLATKK